MSVYRGNRGDGIVQYAIMRAEVPGGGKLNISHTLSVFAPIFSHMYIKCIRQ